MMAGGALRPGFSWTTDKSLTEAVSSVLSAAELGSAVLDTFIMLRKAEGAATLLLNLFLVPAPALSGLGARDRMLGDWRLALFLAPPSSYLTSP